MMLTPIAERLINDLRTDARTRKHFSIVQWHGTGHCGAVGCIAGTAIALAHDFAPQQQWGDQFGDVVLCQGGDMSPSPIAAPILGLDLTTAQQLFIPWEHWFYPLSYGSNLFSHLGENERPSRDYVEEMREWAKRIDAQDYPQYTPDRCALALERVTKDEIPYVDWRYAFENAETI